MLSRDKRLPLDTWNTSGIQENVFGNQFSTFDSRRDHHQGSQSCAPQGERGSVPQATGSGTLFARFSTHVYPAMFHGRVADQHKSRVSHLAHYQ